MVSVRYKPKNRFRRKLIGLIAIIFTIRPSGSIIYIILLIKYEKGMVSENEKISDAITFFYFA